MKSTKISVLMAVYNEQHTLQSAIQSVLDQTNQDWELVIIDDSSIDNTYNLLQEYAKQYPNNIRVYRNNRNLGLAASLNKGLDLCSGEYIARKDADDWSYPERLEKQLNYMEHHPEIDLLGTGAELIGTDGNVRNIFFLPKCHDDIKRIALKKTMIFHPSVMIRKSFFDRVGKYKAKLRRAQDLELWIRGLQYGCKYHNLQEVHIQYATNGYVRSFNTIIEKFFSKLYVCFKYKYYLRIINVFLELIKSILIKLQIYTPRSIK